jgi:hypothetical protein
MALPEHHYCASRKEPPAEELDRLLRLLIREQGILIKTRELLAKQAERRPKLEE